MAIFSVVSCGSVDGQGDVTVVIESRDGSRTEFKVFLSEVENKDEGAVGVLEHLAAREKNPLALDMSSSTYGKFINSVADLTPDTATGEFISVYTSVEADFGTWADVGEKTYGELTLKSSGVGISSMKVKSGCVILLCIETY